MTINPVATSADTTMNKADNQTAGSGLQPQQITTQDFMTLLTTQLQNQDPTNPIDPTQFVTQLAQFTTLDQVSQINGLLQELVQGALPASAPNPANASGTTQTNSSLV